MSNHNGEVLLPTNVVHANILFYNRRCAATFVLCENETGWTVLMLFGAHEASAVLSEGTPLPHDAALVVFPEHERGNYYRDVSYHASMSRRR